MALCLLAILSGPAHADSLRIGFWNTELSRKGPGLLMRDILRGADPQVSGVLRVIDTLDADVLVLGGIDFDAGGLALAALNAELAKPFAYLRALRPNTGLPSGFDLDGNGRRDEARDAIGFGAFPGQGGMAILSRLPIAVDACPALCALSKAPPLYPCQRQGTMKQPWPCRGAVSCA